MQTEEDPLFHELPLHTLITWTRWWHLTSKALVLVLKKRVRGTVGPGVGYQENDGYRRGHIPESDRDDAYHREHIPESNRTSPPRPSNNSRIPPADQVPRGCSLHSMEPLREWFCKGADMTSPAEYEAAFCQLDNDPPDIRQYNVNTREERWTNFSLEGVRFPAMTVDVIQRRSFGYFRKRSHHSLPTDIKSRSSIYPSTVGRHKENS